MAAIPPRVTPKQRQRLVLDRRRKHLVPGYYRWQGANGLVTIDVPANWMRLENSPVPGMIFTAQDAQTTAAVNVFYFPNFQSPSDAMAAARRGVSAHLGGTIHIKSLQQKGNAVYYTGTTSSPRGASEWIGVFAPTQSGVIGFFHRFGQGNFRT